MQKKSILNLKTTTADILNSNIFWIFWREGNIFELRSHVNLREIR